jgi:hypothetical protein
LLHELLDTDTVRELGHALHDSNRDIRSNSINFFIAAIAHGISFHFQGRSILIFVENLRDKIFEGEIVAALGRVLGDINSDIRGSVVEIVAAAIYHGALHRCEGIFILKYDRGLARQDI